MSFQRVSGWLAAEELVLGTGLVRSTLPWGGFRPTAKSR